jgi:tRNA (cmo5U34)-methyltransferase
MSDKYLQDQIYLKKQNKINDFVFDKNVADVFEDMIKRSVPGYELTVSIIKSLVEQYALSDSYCYDLGCSLGAGVLAMQKGINNKKDCSIIAVDNSSAMIEQCRKNIKKCNDKTPVNIICADVLDVEIKRASVVVLNFILQFISKAKRDSFLKNIYKGMLSGGVLFISEKIDFLDKKEKQFIQDLHYSFKKNNGYSELEIKQKRDALENVLIPETVSAHKKRLKQIGFKDVYVCLKYLNFVSIVAIK